MVSGENVKGYAIGAGVLIFGVAIFAILYKTGLLGTSEEARKVAKLKKMPEWNPNHAGKLIKKLRDKGISLETVKSKYAPRASRTVALATQLAGAHRPADLLTFAAWPFVQIDDKEQAVYGAFNALVTTLDFSLLSLEFSKQTKKDLYAYLADFLNKEELARIYDIVKELQKV